MRRLYSKNRLVSMTNGIAQGKRLLLYFLLLSLSVIFLCVFSYSTSPLHTKESSDAAFFRLVGMGMTKGMLPYRDFFDMKGPYLFLIQYLGQLIVYGKTGIFILQIFNLFLALFLIIKICLLYRIESFVQQGLLLCGILVFLIPTINGGNLTEEWSLVPLLSCLFLFLRYECYTDRGIQTEHPPIDGLWYGICFGYLIFIRITNAALIGAGILTISIQLIKEKKISNLLINAACFIAGTIVAILPAVIFFSCNNLLGEMIRSLFTLGFKYSTEKTLLMHITEAVRLRSLLIFIPCILIMLTDWDLIREKLLAFLITTFTFFSVSTGNNTDHYYIIAIPCIVFGGIALIHICKIDRRNHTRRVFAIILTITLAASQIYAIGDGIHQVYQLLILGEQNQKKAMAQEITENINESKDNVFAYGIKTEFYTYANIFPCNKYCGWQEHYIQLMPEIADELDCFFRDTPPTWLVLRKGLNELPGFLSREISQNYIQTFENEMYILYRRIS